MAQSEPKIPMSAILVSSVNWLKSNRLPLTIKKTKATKIRIEVKIFIRN